MSDQVKRAAETLAEELAHTCSEALKKAGFEPSSRLIEKIQDEIRYSLRLG